MLIGLLPKLLADDYKIAAATASDGANLKGSMWLQ